jgi:hypothetical protein
MSNKPVLTAIETPAKEPPDPFDLESLRLSQDFIESAGVKKLVTEIPIRKPSPQDFVRVHPDPAYRADLLMVNLKDDREFYVVRPSWRRSSPARPSRRQYTPPSTGNGRCSCGR